MINFTPNLTGLTLEQIEREVFKFYYEQQELTNFQIAKILGIAERTVYRKMIEFNLTKPDKHKSVARFIIEDDVPPPDRFLYPFKDMKVGQSFYVPNDGDIKLFSLRSKIATAAKNFSVNGGGNMKFSTTESGNGVRVWRVE